MKVIGTTFVLASCALWMGLGGNVALAQSDSYDMIKLLNVGNNPNPKAPTQFAGKITAHSASEVTIRSKDDEKAVPANEIAYIQFAGAGEVASVRRKIRDGELEKAHIEFKSIKRERMESPGAQSEYDFVKALLAIRQAQSGQGNLSDGGKLLYAFIQGNKDNYNYFPACELMGDVFVAIGNFNFADKMFAEVAKAPWPEYKMRASISGGRALLSQGKSKEAIDKFSEALNNVPTGSPGAEKQILAATLGKAEAIALGGKADEGLKIAEDLLAKAPADDVELHARIYNTIGNCQRNLKREKEALLAFLHVHLLYSNFADADAEALSNLAELWGKQGRPDRANECRGLLQSKYPGSRWTLKKNS